MYFDRRDADRGGQSARRGGGAGGARRERVALVARVGRPGAGRARDAVHRHAVRAVSAVRLGGGVPLAPDRAALRSEPARAWPARCSRRPPARRAAAGSPLVVIVPGSGGTAREENYHWSARELAAHGYVVVGVDPQGVGRSATFGEDGCDPAAATEDLEYPYPCPGVPFQQRTNFDDAALSAIAWGAGRENPYRRLVDAGRVGVAGHSLGAAAAIAAQERDRRVQAIVAWDGMAGKEMATDTNAPTHHAVNGHVPVGEEFDRDIEVRAPALGLHSDHETTSPYDSDPAEEEPRLVALAPGRHAIGDLHDARPDPRGLRPVRHRRRQRRAAAAAVVHARLVRPLPQARPHGRAQAARRRRSSASRATRCSARASRRRSSCPSAASTAPTSATGVPRSTEAGRGPPVSARATIPAGLQSKYLIGDIWRQKPASVAKCSPSGTFS